MSVLKQKIMDSANRFFLEKGYLATSIQNITDDCGVAKGTFYKFFQSKEDLFIEVHLLQQQRMFDRIEEIRADQTFSSKEVFIHETEYQIEFLLDNNFIMQEMKELVTPDGKIKPYLFRFRGNILKYNKESLTRVFGEVIQPNSWDLVMIYNGMMREFVFLYIFEKKALRVRDIATFIVQCMEDMATNMIAKTRSPLLQDSDMSEYMHCAREGEKIPDHKRILDLIQYLMSTIKELPIPNSSKTELEEAVLLLQSELECEHPRVVLIRALIALLGRENGLKDMVTLLEKFIMNHILKE